MSINPPDQLPFTDDPEANHLIATDPQSAPQIKSLYDVGDGQGGDCTNDDSSKGHPGDGVIAPCEVGGNSLLRNLFAPDVRIFAADGVTYQPSPQNTAPDSLSFGFAFTAVRAQF